MIAPIPRAASGPEAEVLERRAGEVKDQGVLMAEGESAARKPLRVRLYAISFLVDATGHAYPLIVSAQAREVLGASPFELGVLGTLTAFVYAIGCVVTGAWSDRTGSWPLIRAGMAILTFAVLPLAMLAQSITPLYFAAAGIGLGLALFWPPAQRELSFLSPGRTLWRSLGAFNLSWAAGASLGTYLAPVLREGIGYVLTLAVSLGAVVAALPLTSRRSPPVAAPAGSPEPIEPLEAVDPARAALFLRLAWASNFAASFAFGGLHNVFVHVSGSYGLGAGWLAAILGAKEIGRVATFLALRVSGRWHYSLGWLAGLQAAAGAALVLGGFLRNPYALCGVFLLLGAFSGLAYYSSIYYALNLRSGEGRKSGIHEAILAVGLCLGPLACGTAGGSALGPGSIIAVPGAVILLVLAVELVGMAARRRPPERGEG